ncbi:MAG TPA: class I SAM-dependent methyltransferase [Thermoanaerobaculia bacterium]|nr:class I SAM-dependent methyltransferase [Thermoanaerobaculia bacterium]
MSGRDAAALPAETAYRLWAESYDEENPLTTLDHRAAALLTPPLAGRTLLDAACGTARRLAFGGSAGPRLAAGVDLVFEMLRRGRTDRARRQTTAAGDLRALPLRSSRFDVVWCRLAAGHLPRIAPLYRELARVLAPGGRAIVTDFHPAAVAAGHRRLFRDTSGKSHLVAHVVHEPEAHERAAAAEGLLLESRIDLPIGEEVRVFFERAGALYWYERDRGLPLLLALRFRR